MTDRPRLDDLTSDQYDQLCDELEALRQVARGYCPHCGRGDAAPTVAHWERERQRADQAEARLQATSQAAGTLLTRTTDERDQLKAALIAVLGLFPHDLNPNGPAIRSRHVPAELVQRWRTLLAASDEPTPDQPATLGPIVDRPFRTHRQHEDGKPTPAVQIHVQPDPPHVTETIRDVRRLGGRPRRP